MATGALLQEPELRPFLPLLWLAWADGDLGPDERALIRARIEAQPWLKPRLRLELEQWLEPSDPPSASELAEMRTAIVVAAKTLSTRGLRSLVTIAESMAALDESTLRFKDTTPSATEPSDATNALPPASQRPARPPNTSALAAPAACPAKTS